MKKRFLVLTLFLLYISYSCVSMNRVYTVADGLASDIVYCIIQDNKGFTWFGTNNGVSQFDGYTFKNYSIDDGLTDNEIFKIFQDSQGRIWFLTYSGKLCYYWEGEIHNEKNTPFLSKLSVPSFFTHVVESENKELYFFKEYSKQFYKLSGEVFNKIEIENTFQYNSLFLKNKSVCVVSISVLANGKKKYSLYNVSSKPLFIDSFESNLVYSQFTYFNNKFIAINRGSTGIEKLSINHASNFNISNAIIIDSDNKSGASFLNSAGCFSNKYFVATSDGLCLYDNNLAFIQKLATGISVNTCLIDFENGIWAGTKGNGVHYYSQTSVSQIATIEDGAYGIHKNTFNENEFWIRSIGSCFSYNVATNKIKKYDLPESINRKDLITDIAFISKDELLIGNGQGVSCLSYGIQKTTPDKAGIKNILINNDSIYYARSNGIIVQHKSNLFKKCTYKDSTYKQVYNYRTNSLYQSQANGNRIWFGTADGLFYLSENKVIKYSDKVDSRITHIIESSLGNLTFCSDLDGLYIIQNDSVMHLTTHSGLISNRINGICYDSNNILWVATAKGISRVVFKQSIEIKNYSTANGLPDISINDLYSLNDSILILATSTGLYSYNHYKEIAVAKPYTNIISLKVNSNIVKKEKLSDLKYYENNIELAYTGVSYASNKNIEYWYALKSNSDTAKWFKLNAPYLNFINLTSGNYILLLKCKNIQGVWSDLVTIPIHINKPFYQTWWFYLFSCIAFIAGTLFFFIRYSKKIKKEQAIATLISETRQKALRAQLNPHFIFNALNSIQYLFLSNEEDLAQEYLSKFSSILRNTLNYSEKTYISLSDELENIKLYMELEQIRKKNLFKFIISIDDKLNDLEILVPSMFLQPIVENAIWHGIQPLKTEGEIRIAIVDVNDVYFEINIIDNGIGYSESKKSNAKLHQHKSKGSELITDRLKTLNFRKGEHANFNIIDIEQGTCVKIKLPKKYNNV